MQWIEEELLKEINKLSVGDYVVFNEKPQIIRTTSGFYESIPHNLSGKVWQIKASKYPNMVLDLVHSDDVIIRQSINREELEVDINKVDKGYADLMRESISIQSLVEQTIIRDFSKMAINAPKSEGP